MENTIQIKVPGGYIDFPEFPDDVVETCFWEDENE